MATDKYISNVFYVMSRSIVTKHLHQEYFRDIHYYQLNVLDDTIDNPWVLVSFYVSYLTCFVSYDVVMFHNYPLKLNLLLSEIVNNVESANSISLFCAVTT